MMLSRTSSWRKEFSWMKLNSKEWKPLSSESPSSHQFAWHPLLSREWPPQLESAIPLVLATPPKLLWFWALGPPQLTRRSDCKPLMPTRCFRSTRGFGSTSGDPRRTQNAERFHSLPHLHPWLFLSRTMRPLCHCVGGSVGRFHFAFECANG